MIIKLQISLSLPKMILVYNKAHTVMGQFEAVDLPDWVVEAVQKGFGKAFFKARLIGSKVELLRQVSYRDW